MDPADQFKSHPNVNPVTQQTVVVGSKDYKKLVKLYGEPNKIKSPKSQSLIGVNKGEYKKLIKQGYTDNQLIGNRIQTPIVDDNRLPDDVMMELLLRSDVTTIMNLCRTNKSYLKICQGNNDQDFWKQKITRDGLPLVGEDIIDNYKDGEYNFAVYKQLSQIRQFVMTLLSIIDLYDDKNYMYIKLIFNVENDLEEILQLLPFDVEMGSNRDGDPQITISYDKKYKTFDLNNDDDSDHDFTKDVVINTLIKLLYHYPDNTIFTEFEP